jgi:hypothetical protein
MKRNLLLLAVMLAATLFFTSQSWAQAFYCPDQPADYGYCDTVVVETFDCDHIYTKGALYDSVRVAVYVVHDSNTFFWQGGNKWVQDSIRGIAIPLIWWAEGCADSIVFPTYDNWNNKRLQEGHSQMPRSIFRDIVDTHTGEITYNRLFAMIKDPYFAEPWSTYILFNKDTVGISAVPMDPGCMSWGEGPYDPGPPESYGRVLFATLTFLVYMGPDCDTAGICLDSCFWPPGTAFSIVRYEGTETYTPKSYLPICDTIYIPPNEPPDITCSGDFTTHKAAVVVDFDVDDPEGDATTVTFAMVPAGGGTGVLNPNAGDPPFSGTFTYTPDCTADKGKTFTVTLTATDAFGGTDQCSFTITVTNQPPSITCPANDSCFNCSRAYTSGPFSTSDPEGDHVDVYLCGITPTPAGPGPYVSGSVVKWDESCADTFTTFTLTLCAVDQCGDTGTCTFTLSPCPPPPPGANEVKIPNYVFERFGYGHWDPADSVVVDDFCYPYGGINPGDFFEIPIILNNFGEEEESGERLSIGAFEFEIEFDYVDLTFYGVERGALLMGRYLDEETGEILYSWEYFSYRLCPCAYPGCLKYKIVIFGQAEMPDGLYRIGYCLAPNPRSEAEYWATTCALYHHTDEQGEWTTEEMCFADLLWMRFQVANNELLRDLKLPVVFEWEHKLSADTPYYIIQDWDCAENSMSDCDGKDLYVSNNTMQFEPDVCGEEFQNPPLTILTFIDGGAHICSPCTTFKCTRGDVNLNHIAYDPGDPVLLAHAIVHGEVVFWEIAEQTCASDVNADGRPLMLADLIYMIRVIQGDAIAYPKLGPSSDVANLIVSGDRISVECASPIGGILFEFAGSVTPTLLATNMEVLANEGRVLVWNRDGHSIDAGVSEVLSATGELVSATVVDREGRDLATTITAKVAPSSFALHPAYPNPFNPNTNLSFSLPNAIAYNLKIYNVAGQLVRSYEGMGTAGLNVITWDGKDNAGNDVSSGVYFCKLSADTFTATNKMVLMK